MKNSIDKGRLYDVIVVGGGPAGLTAALYLARARYRVLVVEKERFGGQITITSEIVNFPGVERASGAELTDTMRRQAAAFGAEFLLAEVTGIEPGGDIKTLKTSAGDIYCFGILIATGAHPRQIGFKGEQEFKGRGVAYCATCDGEFFTGKEVFVVGGGFAAAEESVFLTKYAKHVTILIRESDFTCAAAVAEPAKNHPRITVITDAEVEEVSGGAALQKIRYRSRITGQSTEYAAPEGDSLGVFVFAGYQPATGLLRGIAELDDQGYVVTDPLKQTSAAGIYAAGDVCIKPLRQVVTAVGDGALAATELERYAAAMHRKTGIQPEKPEPAADKPESGDSAKEGFFSEEVLSQLRPVFSRMQSTITLRLYLDEKPVSAELRRYMEELSALTDKLKTEISAEAAQDTPCVKLFREDGGYTGLAFHGVPGGHEFTSFVLGIYNAAGPGQPADPAVIERVRGIRGGAQIKVLVSLTCTMCPELVTAAQRAAAENPNITAEVYDLNHFPELREKYNVMSVPCLVLNDRDITFGKKNLSQLADWLVEHI